MKLSKQERIGAFIIAIVVILAVGAFVFIKPRIEQITVTTTNLENKQNELVAALEKQSTKDPLKEQVIEAFEAGEDLANMFFEEMTVYEAEEELRNFLSQVDANILVESVSVTSPTTYTFTPTFFSETEVMYDLKNYATQGLEPTEEEIAAAARQEILRNNLNGSQTVGAITLSFTVSAIEQDELLKFFDEVNAYYKEENGVSTRKAMTISGFAFDYPLIVAEYEDLMTEILAKAEEQGLKELYAEYGKTPPAKQPTQDATTDGTQPAEDTPVLSDNLISVSTTLTMYSLERMQDPTDQLDAQDGIEF